MKRLLLGLLLVMVCRAQDYFPARAFSDRADWSSESGSSYSKYLKALEEPSLFSLKSYQGVECYRFTWLRSFERPVALRVDVDKSGVAIMAIKVSDHPDDKSPAKIVKDEIKVLTEEQLQQLRRLFRREFFKEPSHIEDQGVDGARWIIETVNSGRYHVVSRHSPNEGPVRQIGDFLLKIAALGDDAVPIY